MKRFMLPAALFLLISAAFAFCAETQADLKPVPVRIVKSGADFKFYRGDDLYYIKGAGYRKYMDRLAKAGGNSIRTWGTENGLSILDEAQKYNLTVTMGLWMTQERQGFDYGNQERVQSQQERFSNNVEQFKNHPALLIWGVGNELELGSKSDKFWEAVEQMARMIHRIDPNHPTMAVTSGIDVNKIAAIQKYAPSIDILGVNEYGDIYGAMDTIKKSSWNKPFIITEWGNVGHWSSPKTSWGALIEFPSGIQRDIFIERYNNIREFTNQCLGSYVFLWGQKQERTSTWFSLFLPTGEATEMENAMEFCWAGKWPKYKAPNLTEIRINNKTADQNVIIEPDTKCTADVTITPEKGSPLNYVWQVFEESTSRNQGGDAEYTPREVPDTIVSVSRTKAIIKAPTKKGAYRLYVKVMDSHGNAANANFPFYVK